MSSVDDDDDRTSNDNDQRRSFPTSSSFPNPKLVYSIAFPNAGVVKRDDLITDHTQL